MARKEPRPAPQRLRTAEAFALRDEAEVWLDRIRTRLPDDATAVVTVHRIHKRKYLVSFRATAYGETFISEAREERLQDGLREAGRRLFERLGSTPPAPKPRPRLRDRVRRFFREAG